jgi:uncharacterized protein (TIGR01777 family)
MRVLITGGTGFIGQALVRRLLDGGHVVTVLTRDPARCARLFDGRARGIDAPSALAADEVVDAVVNLAGEPVIGPRWSAARRAKLLASRVGTTRALGAWLATAQQVPALWVQASAIGYYGVRDPAEPLTEESRPGSGFMAELCLAWERAAREVQWPGMRLVILRLGVVFGRPGGALLPLLLPHRFGLGPRLGSGRQMTSWIHRDDVLALVARAFADDTMQGVYNAVAPQAVSQADFAAAAGRVLGRPVWLRLPAAPIRWLLGEMAELFVDGQRVLPARLQAEGWRFRFPTLEAALRDLA